MYRPVPSGAADAGTAGRPLHTIRSCLRIMPTNAHRTRPNVDHSTGFAEKPTEKPIERCSISVSFFFRFFRPSHFLLSVHNPGCMWCVMCGVCCVLRAVYCALCVVCNTIINNGKRAAARLLQFNTRRFAPLGSLTRKKRTKWE